MNNISTRPIRLLLLFIALFALPQLACNVTWQDQTPRAERPVATSTPVSSVQAVKPPPRLLVPPPATPEPPATESLHELSTAEQLARIVVPTRDLRQLAMRFSPTLDEIPLYADPAPPEYTVGDRILFWVHDLGSNSNYQITAELIHKTDVAYAWVEVDRPFNSEAIVTSVDRFSRQSYPAIVAFYGSEWNPGVDGDPRVHILHAQGLGSGIAGYYSSADQYSRQARPFSNEKEMFYVNLAWLNTSQSYEYYETVLAHEFQHMIHWHNDRNEETWVNEGLSEYAQEVAGYDSDSVFVQVFLTQPDTQLNTWGEDQGDNGAHYGNAYLFISYFVQRFGPELAKTLVTQQANGIQGFEQILLTGGYDLDAGFGFDDIFADWVVATYVDDPYALGSDGIYGYLNTDLAAPILSKTHEQYPVTPVHSSVQNYGIDYVELQGSGDLVVNFEGQTSTRLADVQPYSGERMWWGHRGDDINTYLTRRFDLRSLAPDTSVEMTAAMWWDIEQDYDYGHVSVSLDGNKWELLSGEHTTTANPSGNSFGPGYTGHSGNGDSPQWIVESIDLSDYAGNEIWLRFDYITDDAVNASGWFIDDIRIPALDYATGFESGSDGWQSEGWLLADNLLAQQWLVQLLRFRENRLVALERIEVDERGSAIIPVPDLNSDHTAVLAISGLTRTTTQPATYTYNIEPAP